MKIKSEPSPSHISPKCKYCRKRTFQDIEKLPLHEFGIYSIAEKACRQRPVLFNKSSSPPPPIQRQARSDLSPPLRPRASKLRQDEVHEEEEIFITSCDLTNPPSAQTVPLKGCVLKTDILQEEDPGCEYRIEHNEEEVSLWKKCLCCRSRTKNCDEGLWNLAVRCAKFTPERCQANIFCTLLDMIAPGKTPEKEPSDWRLKMPKLKPIQKVSKGDLHDDTLSRRCSGAGEPRFTLRSCSPSIIAGTLQQRLGDKSNVDRSSRSQYTAGCQPITTFRTTQGPALKNINDAKNFLIRSSICKEKEKQLNSAITITPQYSFRTPSNNYTTNKHINITPGNQTYVTPSSYSAAFRGPTQPQNRRRLGRSPSPSPSPSPTRIMDRSRATNTNSPLDKFLNKDASKSTLREALSRLKMSIAREGSIGAASVGAASLGAQRDAPAPKRAPSVRSDERPTATQGDMLNSIKFQRRYRDTDKFPMFSDKARPIPKDKPIDRDANSRLLTGARLGYNQNFSNLKEKPISSTSKGIYGTQRPTSPKGRRNTSNAFY